MNFDSIEQARSSAIAAMQSKGATEPLTILTPALAQFPQDGLLLFLHASELAELGQYEQALEQFAQSIFNEPTLHIARFQLSLLAATLERFDLLEQHLPVLMELGESHYLGLFANALAAVFAGELERAASLLQAGIASNQENPALNHDMQQMLGRISVEHSATTQQASTQAPTSADAENSPSDKPQQEPESLSTLSGSVLLDIYKNTH